MQQYIDVRDWLEIARDSSDPNENTLYMKGSRIIYPMDLINYYNLSYLSTTIYYQK